MRKYEKGDIITSLDDFASVDFIYDNRINKVYSRGWFQSWQFRYVESGIRNKWFSRAVLKGGTDMKCDNCGKGIQFGKRADGPPNGIEFELENGERAVYCIECLEEMRLNNGKEHISD